MVMDVEPLVLYERDDQPCSAPNTAETNTAEPSAAEPSAVERSAVEPSAMVSMYQVTEELNVYLRGWVSYFRIQEFRRLFRDLDGWIRSRLRSMQLKKWKNPRKFQRMMIRAGFKPQQAHRVWVKMNKWQSVERREVRFVMDLKWYRKQRLIFLHDFTQRQQPLELIFSR